MIDAYLRSTEDLDDRVIHLLFSGNRWEARSLFLVTGPKSSENIKRDLLAGTTIVLDRYVYSGVAFSTAKVGRMSFFIKYRDWTTNGAGIQKLVSLVLILSFFYPCLVTQLRRGEGLGLNGMRTRRCNDVCVKYSRNYKRTQGIRAIGASSMPAVRLSKSQSVSGT